jgi:predicted nucleic acid-binding protein
MTVVIADSSPLNYLALIGSVEVLHRLYGVVVVPRQVISELLHVAAPHDVRRWASNLPDWIDVREAVISDDDMPHLDAGERAAIALAQSEPDILLLIDETAGRIEASRRGIRNTGTLGVLRASALKCCRSRENAEIWTETIPGFYAEARRAFWASSASRFRYDSPSIVRISA